MKNFTTYINESEIKSLNEAALQKLMDWFKGIYRNQVMLEKKPLKVDDVKNIKGPEESIKLEELEKNTEELNLIDDKKVGFPQTSAMIKKKTKYLVKEGPDGKPMDYKVLVDRYFYVNETLKYDIAMILYDKSIIDDKKYVNLLSFEVIQKIVNGPQIEKFIMKSWENKMTVDGFKGAQYVVIDTFSKMKLSLKKLQYKAADDDKDEKILLKEFK